MGTVARVKEDYREATVGEYRAWSGEILKGESFPYYTDTWTSEAREKT